MRLVNITTITFYVSLMAICRILSETNCIHPGPALPSGKVGDYLGRWAKVGAKIQLCASGMDELTPKKGINMMNVNETHDHAVYQKIKVMHYSSFAAEWLIINVNFTCTREAMSQFGINFIHIRIFSYVQNVLRISVMYLLSTFFLAAPKYPRRLI